MSFNNRIFSSCKFYLSFLLFTLISLQASAQQATIKLVNQYDTPIHDFTMDGTAYQTDNEGMATVLLPAADSVLFDSKEHKALKLAVSEIKKDKAIVRMNKNFTWKDLINPSFYIVFGGLWLFLFIVFAETGLFAGFFLPGDSLLFVAGIYSYELISKGLGIEIGSDLAHLLILTALVIVAGVLGNAVGYWFGKKSGPSLYHRKDSFFFKKKYLSRAQDFYDENGAGTIVAARFLPIIRTFAPIVAGIVQMDKKKFTYYNILGCILWSVTMLFAGHYLYKIILTKLDFDLKKHLEIIVLGIVAVTTLPVIWKLFFQKKKNNNQVA